MRSAPCIEILRTFSTVLVFPLTIIGMIFHGMGLRSDFAAMEWANGTDCIKRVVR